MTKFVTPDIALWHNLHCHENWNKKQNTIVHEAFSTHKSNLEQASLRDLGFCSLYGLLRFEAFIVKW